jgi:hypothetical protein
LGAHLGSVDSKEFVGALGVKKRERRRAGARTRRGGGIRREDKKEAELEEGAED